MRPIVLLGHGVAAWWRELLLLLVLNFVWLVLQVTVVLGPPATAALYVIGQRVLDGEIVDFGDFVRALRGFIGPGWAWGAAQLVVYGVLAFNLLYYRDMPGLLVSELRYLWVMLAFVWFALNLYYWPLYMAEKEPRFTTTLANTARMALLNPGFTLVYAFSAIGLIVISIVTGLGLGAILGIWLALWGLLAVQDRLARAE